MQSVDYLLQNHEESVQCTVLGFTSRAGDFKQVAQVNLGQPIHR